MEKKKEKKKKKKRRKKKKKETATKDLRLDQEMNLLDCPPPAQTWQQNPILVFAIHGTYPLLALTGVADVRPEADVVFASIMCSGTGGGL